MIENLKRQLAQQGQGGAGTNAMVSGAAAAGMDRRGSGGSMMTHQQMMQMQALQSGANNPMLQQVAGMMQDQLSGGAASFQNQNQQQQKRGSTTSNEPISLHSLMGSQGNQTNLNMTQMGRGSSTGSDNLMGMMGGNSNGNSNFLMQQQQQQQQSSLNKGRIDQHILAAQQQQLMSASGLGGLGQSSSSTGQGKNSKTNELISGLKGDLMTNISGVGSNNGMGEDKAKSAGNQGAKNESENPGAPSSQQSFLDGTFNGGWQSNADIPDRRRVIYSICKVIEQMRPDARQMSQKLPFMAKRLEEHLYRSAQTKEEYLDPSTLKKRLQMIAHGLEVHRGGSSSSGGTSGTNNTKKETSSAFPPSLSKTSSSSNVMSNAEIAATQQKMKHLMQQFQQLQHLQHLQQQQGQGHAGSAGMNELFKRQSMIKEQLLQEQAKLQQAQQQLASGATMQQDNSPVADMMVQSQQSVPKSSSKRGSGILKSGNSKYQDPQKRKVIKQQQQRLLLLRHASKCKAGPDCKVRFCGQMVQLWKHMKKCRDKNCKTAHCLSSRCVLNHYRICKSENKTSSCEVCGPVMRQIKQQQGSQNLDDDPSIGGGKDQSQAPDSGPSQQGQQSGGNSSDLLSNMAGSMSSMGNIPNVLNTNHLGGTANNLGGMSGEAELSVLGGVGSMNPDNGLGNLGGMRTTGNGMGGNSMMTANTNSNRSIDNMNLTNSQTMGASGNVMSGKMDSFGGVGNGMGNTMKSEKPMHELQQAHQKIQQQHLLLKQLQEQQAQLLEQQKQLQQRQQQVSPQTQQGKQLQQQQALLQQLQNQFQQQQHMLQQELLRQSTALEKTPGATQLVSTSSTNMGESQEAKRRSSQTKRTSVKQKLTGHPAGIAARKGGRSGPAGSKGKRLSALESQIPHSDHDSIKSGPIDPLDSFESGTNKRDADELGTGFGEPPAKKRQGSEQIMSADIQSSSKIFAQGDQKLTACLTPSMSSVEIKNHLDSLKKDVYLSPKLIKQTCLPVIRRLLDDQFGWVFRDPVDPGVLGLPDYFEVVERPMHLALIEKKLVTCSYLDLESFVTDAKLVFENAILYNGQHSEVGEMAQRMIDRFLHDFNSVMDKLKSNMDHLVPGADICSLCNSQRRLLRPVSLFCTAACGKQNIPRNSTFYVDSAGSLNWCEECYSTLGEGEIIRLGNGKQTKKVELKKRTNEEAPEEAWIQCDDCESWVHHCCSLFNGDIKKWDGQFVCPKCVMMQRASGELDDPKTGLKGVSELPKCVMSRALEKGLDDALGKAYLEQASKAGKSISEVEKAHGLSVRVISNVETNQPVGDRMLDIFGKKGFPSSFPCRSKCIALFQKIGGVDVIIFAMFVHEYDQSCPAPNRRRVYLSHFDSINLFTPRCYQNTVNDALVVEYLRYVKERGFHTAHVWSCPPAEGDDSLFHCHPPSQEPPRDDLYLKRYMSILKKAKIEGIITEAKTFYDEYFANRGMTDYLGKRIDPTCLPYFRGDFVAQELDHIVSRLSSQKEITENYEFLCHKTMSNLAGSLSKTKNSVLVFHLLSRKFVASVDRGDNVSNWAGQDELMANNKRPKIGGKTSPGTIFPPMKADTEESMLKGFVIKEEPLKPPDDGVGKKDGHDKDDDAISLGTVSVSLGPKDSSFDAFGLDDSDKGGKDDLDPLSLDLEPDTLALRGGGGEDSDEKDVFGIQDTLESKHHNKRGFDEIEPAIERFAAENSYRQIGDTTDPDGPFETDFFESRQHFIDYCQRFNYQFDELRRAKHSTMVLLSNLHNSTPKLVWQCGACYKAVVKGAIYHCTSCDNYDLCNDCFKPVTSGEWSNKGPSYQHDTNHTFVQDDGGKLKNLGENQHLIDLHCKNLEHAALCNGSCSNSFCPKVKKLIQHLRSCEKNPKEACPICSRAMGIIKIHSRKCTIQGSCSVPCCDGLRDILWKRRKRQDAMDERRWRAQKELYESSMSQTS